MGVIKCKMCGGDLQLTDGRSIATCEYCGTTQTVPEPGNEKKMTLFGRANRLLRACEFDKAAGVFESVAAEFPEEAEAYWGLVLCKYGIEYVDDPATGKKVPTCHRSSFDSVLENSDFEQALENADVVARKVYRDEAKAIEKIRRGILEVSGKEEPYDIFICYKERDESGNRTLDSVLAQDIYDALTGEGYRVFFSRVTLEDKLGTDYEPYIFAALNSARIMLAVGTDYEYYNAVWVKNEWSRFLSLIAAGQKKVLIPCFKNLDPYDMPKEFARLQSQDMGKVGAMQDLIRGVRKILSPTGAGSDTRQAAESGGGADTAALLRRAFMFLEDEKWEEADKYCERVLDSEPENAEVYLGKLMAEKKLRSREELTSCREAFCFSGNYRKAVQFGDAALQEELRGAAYLHALRTVKNARYPKEYNDAADEFETLAGYRDADQKAAECRQKSEEWKEQRARQLPLIRSYAQGLLVGTFLHTAGLRLDGTVAAAGRNDDGECNVSDWRDIVAIAAAGGRHTVGLKSDGTVVAVGKNDKGQCNVSGWRDIVAIAAGDSHTAGLRSDGTVVAVGDNDDGECNVSGWRDIVAVGTGGCWHTVGLKSDGTVVAVGKNVNGQCNVSDWRDIVAIATGCWHTVGLKSDGTVVAAGANLLCECDVSDWRDIAAIAVGTSHTAGLKSDGTVVAAGRNDDGECNVSGWRDIVAIAAGTGHTLGLKSDGTVVAAGINRFCKSCDADVPDWESCEVDVSDWRDIIAIADGDDHIAGLKSDGTVVAVGKNDEGQCNTEDWKLFDSPEQLKETYESICRSGEQLREKRRRQEEERHQQEEPARALRRAKPEAERKSLETERISLMEELANLKGFFSGRRRRSIETRLGEIETRLAELKAEPER